MKISIKKVRFALFRGSQYYLDLDTGEVVSAVLINDGIVELPNRYIKMPMYSNAPIYQQYLDKLFSEHLIDDPYGISNYPKFEVMAYDSVDDLRNDRKAEYIDKAYYFINDLENNEYISVGKNSKIPNFNEYYTSYTQEIAKSWCQKEGLDLIED